MQKNSRVVYTVVRFVICSLLVKRTPLSSGYCPDCEYNF